MVYLKTETKNKKTYPDGHKSNNNLVILGEFLGKLVVLSIIILLGYPKFWNYLNGSEILVKPIYFKMVFTVLTFIIMVLYFALINNNSIGSTGVNGSNGGNSVKKSGNILLSSIVLVYVIYIWTRKEEGKDGFIIMDEFDEEDMDLIHSKKENSYSKGIGMYPIEESKDKKDLVHGLNKPEHYDFTPDDIPTFQLNNELKIFKQMSDMKKGDINANWMNKVEGHDPSFVPAMEGGFPFYDTKEKVHDLFNNKHPHQEWNESILTALMECPRTSMELLDKSGDSLPGISNYNRKSGKGQNKYKYLEETIEEDSKTGKENTIQIPDVMNEYKCDSDEANFKIGDNSMNISQGCSNFPIPGYSNLKKINDNTAYGIEQDE